jgi:ribosomal protein L7/L12
MPGEYTQATIAAYIDQTRLRLGRIEEQVALVSERLGMPWQPASAGVPADVVELARAGKTMEAIKRYREMTDATFEEARDAVSAV